jgi:cell division protein ZapD
MSPQTCYEQPLSKPVRLFLRYEQLMERFEWSLQQPTPGGAHAAMVALLDLYQHSMHVDLKAEALREIDRLGKALEENGDTLGADCEEMIQALQSEGVRQIHNIHGQLGAQLRNHHFFNLIRQRILMPGGINSFDLPVYHHWLTQQHETRAALLRNWADAYSRYNEVVRQILTITRNHHRTETLLAEHGYFEKMLGPADSVQLLQICVPPDLPCYPEVSSGRQRFSIRFFDPKDLSERPGQTRDNITFEIRFCGV